MVATRYILCAVEKDRVAQNYHFRMQLYEAGPHYQARRTTASNNHYECDLDVLHASGESHLFR